MKTTDTHVPITICRYNGATDRFFAKYKDDKEPNPKKRWKKIPGGPFPPAINTLPKATAFARDWYEIEMAERSTPRAPASASAMTWTAVCDAFIADVDKRVRGADASRDELKKRASFLRSAPLFCTAPIAQHTDELALTWIRKMLSEPLERTGEPRDPLTVRNVKRVLSEIYKFAQRRGYFPKGVRLPTEGEELKAELAGALKDKAKLGVVRRPACPIETVSAIVGSSELSDLRRVMTAMYALAGLRPGEGHGLLVSDYRAESGIVVLDVRGQWTLPRKGYPSKMGAPKTLWGKRRLPVHASLRVLLDAWIAEGWRKHVGRAPTPDDVLFPDPSGNAFRDPSCEDFLADVARAGCATVVQGVALDVYSLRHTFATIARRAGVSSDARDRLLGHRPKDTKAMHYEDDDLPLLAAEIAKIPAPFAATKPVGRDQPDRPSRNPERRFVKPARLVRLLVPSARAIAASATKSSMISAEEVRFELTDPLRDRRFSKPLP